jgi:hypothetical protein
MKGNQVSYPTPGESDEGVPSNPYAAPGPSYDPDAAAPAQPQSEQLYPPAAQPFGAQPVGTQPASAQPLGAQPLGAQPLGAQPVGTQPYPPPGQPYPPSAQNPAGRPYPPVAPYGYGQPPVAPPAPGSNGFSIAAIILAFVVSPLGIVFSILGIVRAGKVGGKGRILSIIALVISLLGSVLWGAFAYGVTRGVKQVVTCNQTERQIEDLSTRFQADSSDPAAYKKDLQDVINILNTSADKVSDSKSAADMRRAAADFQELLNDVNNGTEPSSTLGKRLTTDGAAVDKDCS